MKFAALPLLLLSAGLLAVAQTPAPNPAAAPRAHRPAPQPTNLQVLPKTMTGEQVHELMHQWEDELGAECSTCHTADPKNLAPNGKPRLNFADDSKPEKATARQMVRMVEAINVEYISKIPNSDMPVTCGTCHRGKLSPAPFAAKGEDHDHKEPPPPPREKPSLPR